MFHKLANCSNKLNIRFNNPFYYEPDQLCLKAVEEVKTWIENADANFRLEIEQGKMFGVLIVEKNNELGFIAGYSGQICGRSDWDNYVPAVFDYLQPGGYFKSHEAEISSINNAITSLDRCDEKRKAITELQSTCNEAESETEKYKEHIKKVKAERPEGQPLSEEMIRQSQFMKAELHRIKKRYSALIADKQSIVDSINNKINILKQERRQKSDKLQRWLFKQFKMLNAKGEQKDLIDIFYNYNDQHAIPPAGSGECCEPKMLQYAFLHEMRPISMAMFWWGKSPKEEIRHHLHFYPACNNKCKPILKWMLQGVDVEENPLESDDNRSLEIIYEDEDIAIVNKPAGMLSVPGKSNRQSVYSIMRDRYKGNTDSPLIVHRLDMATSGLLIIARTMDAYLDIQKQFKLHQVHKKYIACLSGLHSNDKDGTISLPLRPDINDRPRQLVDHINGKEAITKYHFTASDRVELYPQTGRTHQLRMHCAHNEGLANPIKGDELYGKKDKRLYLHAEELTFIHPTSKKEVTFFHKADF